MASAISRNSRVLSTTVFTNSTNANGAFLYLSEVLPDLEFVLTSFSWRVIGVRVLDIDIDGIIEVNAEGGSILTEVVIILDLQVVVRATVGVIAVNCSRPPRCITTATPGRPTLGMTRPRISSTVPRRSLRRWPGHVLSDGGGGLSVRHEHEPVRQKEKQRVTCKEREMKEEKKEREREPGRSLPTVEPSAGFAEVARVGRRQTTVRFNGEGVKERDGASSMHSHGDSENRGEEKRERVEL
jgi:hypothetical protein